MVRRRVVRGRAGDSGQRLPVIGAVSANSGQRGRLASGHRRRERMT